MWSYGGFIDPEQGDSDECACIKASASKNFLSCSYDFAVWAYHRAVVAGQHHEERALPRSQLVTGARNKYGNATPGSEFRRLLSGHLAEAPLRRGWWPWSCWSNAAGKAERLLYKTMSFLILLRCRETGEWVLVTRLQLSVVDEKLCKLKWGAVANWARHPCAHMHERQFDNEDGFQVTKG